jgi:hypothetical protein
MSQHVSNILEHSKTRSQKSHDAQKKEPEYQVKDENTAAGDQEKNQRKIRLGLDAKQKYRKKVSDLRNAHNKNGQHTQGLKIDFSIEAQASVQPIHGVHRPPSLI